MIYQKHRLTPSTISGRTVQFIAISQYQLIVKEIQLQSRVHERRIKSKSIFMLRILGKKRETERERDRDRDRDRDRESKTWIEGYRASKNNNFPTSFGRDLLQGNFLKFWVWQKLHDIKYVLFHFDVISDITTELDGKGAAWKSFFSC